VSAERHLIVNADDFGQTAGINRGVAEAHEHGIVTSASLMVRGEAASEAATYAARHPELSVGLHVDLGEWSYRNGEWVAEYVVLPSDTAADVADEIDGQLAAFERLLGRPPTHLDSHQHAHRQEPVRSLLRERAARLGVPLRANDRRIAYSGAFYGQTGRGEPYREPISVAGLVDTITALPAGWTELGCHPGLDHVGSMYQDERAVEVATLCDPAVRDALDRLGISLRSFHHLPQPTRTVPAR
jgi:predicted glycoside hydrolase/deacetylase ChbG (UPF0249 family)